MEGCNRKAAMGRGAMEKRNPPAQSDVPWFPSEIRQSKQAKQQYMEI